MSKPSWGCRRWGDYEHDWLDCHECLEAYELYLEEGEEEVKTTVVHCDEDEEHTYIGRPTKWGNPFVLGKDGTRKEVIDKYRAWIATQPKLLNDLKELKGQKLGCWCAPKLCHGHVLAELADKIDFRTGKALWHCKDSDLEVTITGVMGVGSDGRIYLRSDGGCGIPQDEIVKFY